jgi:Bacterial EndoU nuclease
MRACSGCWRHGSRAYGSVAASILAATLALALALAGCGRAAVERVSRAATGSAATGGAASGGAASGGTTSAAPAQGDAATEADSGWSATTPRVNRTHIFQGGVNRRGKPVGFHSRPGGIDPAQAHVVRVLRPANDLGIYEALVEITDPRGYGGSVRKRSTFYPDRLGHAAVVAAILNAWNHRQPGDGGERFRGPSGLGFTIEGYVLDDGSINTAYPIY